MKKRLSIILSMAMVLAMGTTVFAAEGNANVGTGEQNIDVEAKYSGGVTTPTVYSVDVSWDAMEFTYAVGGTNEWNPETHEYEDNTTAQWVANGNTISVVNHSNAAVDASFAFNALDEFSTVNGSFDTAFFTLPSAEGKAVDSAELVGKAALTLDGTLDETVTDFTKIGTITVTIK